MLCFEKLQFKVFRITKLLNNYEKFKIAAYQFQYNNVVQGRQKDIVYHLPFDKELINALPLLAQTTVEDEDKFKVVQNERKFVKKGSGDPNNPKFIIEKP